MTWRENDTTLYKTDSETWWWEYSRLGAVLPTQELNTCIIVIHSPPEFNPTEPLKTEKASCDITKAHNNITKSRWDNIRCEDSWSLELNLTFCRHVSRKWIHACEFMNVNVSGWKPQGVFCFVGSLRVAGGVWQQPITYKCFGLIVW